MCKVLKRKREEDILYDRNKKRRLEIKIPDLSEITERRFTLDLKKKIKLDYQISSVSFIKPVDKITKLKKLIGIKEAKKNNTERSARIQSIRDKKNMKVVMSIRGFDYTPGSNSNVLGIELVQLGNEYTSETKLSEENLCIFYCKNLDVFVIGVINKNHITFFHPHSPKFQRMMITVEPRVVFWKNKAFDISKYDFCQQERFVTHYSKKNF